jgi:hypothetical protein
MYKQITTNYLRSSPPYISEHFSHTNEENGDSCSGVESSSSRLDSFDLLKPLHKPIDALIFGLVSLLNRSIVFIVPTLDLRLS